MRALGGTWALALLISGSVAAAPAAATAAPTPAPTKPAPAAPPAPAASVPAASVPATAAPAAAVPVKPAPAAPPVEYTLSLSQDEWRVRVTLHPGEPQPGQLVELLFDLGRHKEATDPGAGDTAPYENGKLALTITGPGTRTRYLVRALGDAGLYGAHWTPSAKGLWTLTLGPLAPAAPQASPADAGPAISFQVGVGVPMPASAQGHAVQASRVVVAAGKSVEEQTARSVKSVMAELGQRFIKLVDPADPARGDESADAKAELAAMAALSRGLQGRAPKAWAKASGEYDALALDLAAALDKAAQLQDRKAQLAALPPLEESSCLRCHVKFRDGVVTDLVAWPEVKR